MSEELVYALMWELVGDGKSGLIKNFEISGIQIELRVLNRIKNDFKIYKKIRPIALFMGMLWPENFENFSKTKK